MANKKLSDHSMSELQNKIKQLKNVQFVILVLAIIYAAFMFYQMFSGTFDVQVPQIVVPVVIVFAASALGKQKKDMEAEIKNRQSA